MQHSCESASSILPNSAGGAQKSRQAATMAYQGMTIAAMLLLLGSLWVF
jgi:hypothetical protein